MHTKTMMSAFAAVGFAAVAVHADTASVSIEKYLRLHNAYSQTSRVESATNIVSALSLRQDAAYPTSVGQPAFWVDCADTTGWGMYADGGITYVTNIPSKVGSKLAGERWLTTRPGGGDWVGWDNGSTKPLPPMYVANETALGEDGHFLDFGPQGAKRGLLFNTDGAGYNALTNIGTVIAVWGTDLPNRNGGHLLGGGVGSVQYGWHRAANELYKIGGNFNTYVSSCYMFNTHAQSALKNGVVWHDGNIGVPIWTGYVGGWQTLALQCTAATVQASGIGISDKRSNMAWVSSGQEVAELLIFDEVLTREAIKKIELYLEQKWFGRTRTGWNGKASVSVVNAYQQNFKGELNVPADETLEITRLIGGSQNGNSTMPNMTKTGAGTLVFSGAGAQDYTAEFVLNEGTVSFPAVKQTPTVAQLPAHLYGRFDASDLTTVTQDDEGRVSHWANAVTDAEAKRYNRAFSLRQNTQASQPKLIANELGAGLNVVDFGVNTQSSGMYMAFSTNETAVAGSPAVSLSSIQTVVAFIGAQEGGGCLFNNAAFQRKKEDTHDFRNALFGYNPSALVKGADLKVWSNGRPWDPTRGYETPGYQVVAYQTHGNDISYLMRSYQSAYYGGARIGEILIWNRSLNEEEVRDAQAYLMAKWLKRDAPGYARAAGQFVAQDLQNVTVPACKRVTIDVGAGRTVRIGKLNVAAGGELVKTGDGTLEVEQAAFVLDGHVTTKGGVVRGVGVRDVTSAAELAPGATMHLDATDTARMYTKVRSGDKAVCVCNWRDENDKIGIWCPYGPSDLSRAPHITTAADGCNGKSVVNFGRYGSNTWLTNSYAAGCWAPLDRPIHSMRAIYAIIKYHGKTDANGNRYLGHLFSNDNGRNDAGAMSVSWYPWDEEQDITFHPGMTGGLWDGRLISGYNSILSGTGNCRTNGVAVGYNSFKIATNVFQLVEFHPTAGVQAGVIGLDRHISDRMGGFAIAELVVYERPLSEREKVATRNYLMRKWLNPSYNDPLPEAPDKPEIVEHDITVDGEATFDSDADVEKVRVKGEGTLTKTGAGKLTVWDLSTLDGTVNVNEGTLEVLYADPYATPNLPTDGIIYHADATKGIASTTNASNKICVNTWASQASDGVIAVADCNHGTNPYPERQQLIYDPELGYHPVVKMDSSGASFVWKKNGVTNRYENIRSAFWMLGSQEGGGFLLGGGVWYYGAQKAPQYYAWHRGIYEVTNPSTGKKTTYVGTTNVCALLHSGAQGNARSATWRVNGSTVSPTTHVTGGLSGHWDQISMIVKDDDSPVNADGLAFDGRSKVAPNYSNTDYNGHQRLAEVILYDRRVSDEERKGIECYLRTKWNNNMHNAATNVVVNVAAGATLALGGDQTYAGITGAGTIAGNVTAGAFEATTEGGLAVDGTLTIAANPTVAIDYQEGVDTYVIATADAVDGLENLANVTVTGAPEGKRFRLRVKDEGGKKVLKLITVKGFLMIVR